MKISIDNLRRASQLVAQIAELKKAHENAEDTYADVQVRVPSSSMAPLGYHAVTVEVHATTIRAKLVQVMAPLYAELRQLGIDLE